MGEPALSNEPRVGGGSRPVSRVLSGAQEAYLSSPGAIIHLGCTSPHTSSDLPGDSRGPRFAIPEKGWLAPLFGLAPGGVYRAAGVGRRGALLPHLFTLAAPRERGLAVCFLWHFPWAHTPQALPGTLPCGARTFLCTETA